LGLDNHHIVGAAAKEGRLEKNCLSAVGSRQASDLANGTRRYAIIDLSLMLVYVGFGQAGILHHAKWTQ